MLNFHTRVAVSRLPVTSPGRLSGEDGCSPSVVGMRRKSVLTVNLAARRRGLMGVSQAWNLMDVREVLLGWAASLVPAAAIAA